jgi:hypothetical protein
VNPSSPKEEKTRSNNDNDGNRRNARATIDQVSSLYQDEIGMVTPGVKRELVKLLRRFPLMRQWDAGFDGVIRSGVRRLDYLTTCLENVGKSKVVKPR